MKNFREHNGFDNPTIAGSVKIQRKEWEALIGKKISEFQASDNQTLSFQPMERSQRKRIHELAGRHGLLSHSEGRDPTRFVVLMKKSKPKVMNALTIDTSAIELSPEMHHDIRNLMKEFKITEMDVDNHLSVQLARKSAQKSKNVTYKTQHIQPMLIPPKSALSPSSPMQEFRRRLPAFNMREKILEAINRNKVVLITGGTGCGKTTQVPQFLLEEATVQNRNLRIICTQPRRLPAIAVAERVAKERGENVGNTVGYHIRLEMKTGPSTVLTYCTSGVLLRMLTQDDVTKNLSHIILDEIHEREQNTDYLLIALKQAIAKDRDLKIILMSATMEGNLDMFKKYFGDVPVAHIDIPSRLYNVERFYMGDILALTGFMPTESIFTGSFMGSLGASQSFPQMTTWGNEDEVKHPEIAPSYEPIQRPTFSVGQFSTPPPSTRSVQNCLNNLAQQLATTQPIPQNTQQVPQYAPAPPQGGMHHAATWAAGMDQTAYNEYQENQECISYPTTNDDYVAVKEAFGEAIIPNVSAAGMYTTPPPEWMPYEPQQRAGMQYFSHPMDGTVSYPHNCRPLPMNPAQVNNFYNYSPNGENSTANFSRAIRQEHELMDHLRNLLETAYPNRQASFQPDSFMIMKKELVRKGIASEQLAEAYKRLGGTQYAECVDIEFVVHLTKYILNSPIEGAILIFLPGYDDITEVREKLFTGCQNSIIKPDIYTLHSQMNTSDQHRVFERARDGTRKVILSTNIAEASLTIDDVVFVIDTGKVKEKTYDHDSRISQLKTCWIARSNAEQRSGRAGRCREGFCFRLYGVNDYNEMLPTQRAEMQRAAIHEVCLHAKIFAPETMSVRDFLQMAPEPPPIGAIDHSMAFLEQLGALYSEASTSDLNVTNPAIQCEPALTDLGLIIAKLPLEPQLARMLLFGMALKVLTPAVTLVAALSHRDPFIIPPLEDREKCNRARDRYSGMDFSDHLALLRAITEYEQCRVNSAQQEYCRKNFLSHPAMKMIIGIRKQLLGELRRANLITDPATALNDADYNKYSDSWPMIQAAIAAGCYPGIGFTKAGSKLRKIKTSMDNVAGLHPSSVIKRQIISQSKRDGAIPQLEYLAYQELAKLDEGLTLKTVTIIPPATTILCIGLLRLKQSVIKEFSVVCDEDLLEVEEEFEKNGIDVHATSHFGHTSFPFLIIEENWLACKGSHPAIRDLLRLRFKLMSYFLEVIANPSHAHSKNPCYELLLKTVHSVLEKDHERQGFSSVDPREFFNRDKMVKRINTPEEVKEPPQQCAEKNTDEKKYPLEERNYPAEERAYYEEERNRPPPATYSIFSTKYTGNRDDYKYARDNGRSNNDFILRGGYSNVDLPNADYQKDYGRYKQGYQSQPSGLDQEYHNNGRNYQQQQSSNRIYEEDEYERNEKNDDYQPRHDDRLPEPDRRPNERYDREQYKNQPRNNYYSKNESHRGGRKENYDRSSQSSYGANRNSFNHRGSNSERRPRQRGGFRGGYNRQPYHSQNNLHTNYEPSERGGYRERYRYEDERMARPQTPSPASNFASQNVRITQGVPPPTQYGGRNQQSRNYEQNYPRDGERHDQHEQKNEQRYNDEQRDYKPPFNDRGNSNRGSRNGRRADVPPRKYDDGPRRQDDHPRRQDNGPKRQDDNRGRRDDYRNDKNRGGNDGRDENHTRNDEPTASGSRNSRNHNNDKRPSRKVSTETVQPEQYDAQRSTGNNYQGTDEKPPPDPVIHNSSQRNSKRGGRTYNKNPSRGNYSSKIGDDGAPFEFQDEDKHERHSVKERKPHTGFDKVFENSNYKRANNSNSSSRQ